MSGNRRAAYFQARADYFGRAFDDGIVRALLANGFDVDLYAPGGTLPQTLYPADRVRRLDVDYRRAWMVRHARPGRWRRYTLFLGNPDLPMAFAGALAALAGRPLVHACDEIYVGGYEGQARGPWKPLARWGMRRAAFTILTDLVRIPLQREYASLPESHEFLDFPCCYIEAFPEEDRDALRASLGIAPDDFVLSFAGGFHAGNGADWAIRLLDDAGAKLLVQPGGAPDPVTDAFLTKLAGDGRAIYLPERVSWREATRLTGAADLGLVFYRSSKPQFQKMGVSSQKLDNYLFLGMPVVATRQASFTFLEELHAGVLVERETELPAAIAAIRADRAAWSTGARRAMSEHVRPAEKLDALTARFARMERR